MTEQQPDPKLAGAGLSATGMTADQFHPGSSDSGGATYGDPGGVGSADQEVVGADDDADAAQTSEGNAEGS